LIVLKDTVSNRKSADCLTGDRTSDGRQVAGKADASNSQIARTDVEYAATGVSHARTVADGQVTNDQIGARQCVKHAIRRHAVDYGDVAARTGDRQAVSTGDIQIAGQAGIFARA
jgi:hypothetical protein